MRTINILPEDIISKIAAGEVIERPASVVKELLENSIDAGADRISIKIENGGKKLIKVVDNGVGMSKEDLLLCIERHATSKIHSLSDIFNLKTLGFRGEALPSIGAVAKLKISSKPHDQLIGYRIEMEGGRFICLEEVGIPAGTIVEVRDLFYNMPARRKFLKSDKVEADHIIDIITKISLCYPNINFTFEHGKKSIFNLPSSDDLIIRFSRLFGKETANSIIKGNYIYDDISITVYISKPDISRAKGDRLFFYVNKRNIKDKLIMSAVMEAYSQKLTKGRYPQGAIFIQIDPKNVDFNVHPTKQEVRFKEEGKVYKTIFSCIKSLLDSQSLIPTNNISFKIAEEPITYKTNIPQFNEIPYVIGQLKKTYIICETKEGILLVDQHAAHERIIYERLKSDFLNKRIISQKLIEPYQIELGPVDAEKVYERLDFFMNLGIEIKPFGGNTFIITSYPSILKNTKWESFFMEILQENKRNMNAFENSLKIMACYGAIKAGDILNRQEMEKLLEELYKTDIPTNCPHGRPILKQITYHELEKMFKRII